MNHQYINTIEAGQTIDDIYMIKDPILRSTTKGDLYIAMYICDKTGQANGRMWQASEHIYNQLPKPGFVNIKGRSELYQNNLQIIINRVDFIDQTAIDISDFMAVTDRDINEMFDECKQILRQIKNKQIQALVGEFFADTDLMTKFKKAPAAMKMHHNYIGGLLEHTCNMLSVADKILPLYPKINADLVLAGIFVHDMNKTDELCYDIGFSYTDHGQLIGHISQAMITISDKAKSLAEKGTPIDQDIIDMICHIVLSHHGQYDFGSPKLPAMPEAFMVNYIDDMDAKMNQTVRLIEDERSDTNWTSWQHSLGTKLYTKKLE